MGSLSLMIFYYTEFIYTEFYLGVKASHNSTHDFVLYRRMSMRFIFYLKGVKEWKFEARPVNIFFLYREVLNDPLDLWILTSKKGSAPFVSPSQVKLFTIPWLHVCSLGIQRVSPCGRVH